MKIDRKFRLLAINPVTGKHYSEQDAIVLCAKDAAVPAALEAYRDKCIELGANIEHIHSVELMLRRVLDFQKKRGGGRTPDTVGREIPRCIKEGEV